MFGPHLILDGTGCNKEKLASRSVIERLLNNYPDAIGMTKIGGPYMFDYQAPDPDYSGISGIVVIAESHISIHTFPVLDYFAMDIFSCKEFDAEHALDYITRELEVKQMDRVLMQRGLSFKRPERPADLAKVEYTLPREVGVVASGLISAPTASVQSARSTHPAWPTYGRTPDYGSQQTDLAEKRREARPLLGSSRPASGPIPLELSLPVIAGSGTGKYDSAAARQTEPVLVNPTASISGLLDKMQPTGFSGGHLGQAFTLWEQLSASEGSAIVLGIAGQIVPAGMRELVVYLIEHRLVDALVVTGANLFQDLYETLGYSHYLAGQNGTTRVNAGGQELQATRQFVEALSTGIMPRGPISTRDFFLHVGTQLLESPRKGILKAAALVGIPIYSPDLASSPFGTALALARNKGKGALQFDVIGDVLELGRIVSRQKTGAVLLGGGTPQELLQQALDSTALAEGAATHTEFCAVVQICPDNATPALAAAHSIKVQADPALCLPLLVTGLAQRFPDKRPGTPVSWA